MREIKFRGIRIDNNKWIHGSYFLDNSGEDEGHYIKDDVDLMDYEIFPQTVGQYVGLKDKNGVEIYEANIVKCLEISENHSREYVSEVFFEDGCWLVHESKMCDVELYLYDNSNSTKIPLTEIEVIGNIHESEVK